MAFQNNPINVLLYCGHIIKKGRLNIKRDDEQYLDIEFIDGNISINLHSLSLASSDEIMDNIFLKLNLLKNVFTLSQDNKINFKYKGRVIFKK